MYYDNNNRYYLICHSKNIIELIKPKKDTLEKIGTAPKKLDKILSYFCLVF